MLGGCPGFGSEIREAAVLDETAPLCENVEILMAQHCNRCHGEVPQDGSPAGVRTDTFDSAVIFRDRIALRSELGTMPPVTAPENGVSAQGVRILNEWADLGGPIEDCVATATPDVGSDTGSDAGTDTVDGGPDVNPDVGSDVPGDVGPVPLLADVHDFVFTSCSNHHLNGDTLPFLGLDAGLRDRLLASGNQLPSMPHITPGDSSQSYLWQKVNNTQSDAGGSGVQMPIGPDLTGEQLTMLERWIDGGAPE
ncbi:MAG: hypothetical protein ACJAYU_002196 [Bradymonadia bacterium]|jgi:hypothetical protein